MKQIDNAQVLSKPIVTQLVPLEKFYTAEGYHQDYADRNRSNPYIVRVSDPKVEKLKKLYPDHKAYEQKVAADVARLVKERWITREDGDELIAEATKASIP